MKGFQNLSLAFLAGAALALPSRRQSSAPTVDLGYEVHQATVNETGDYYLFSSIPYAEPPVGSLRFQKPVAKSGNSSEVNVGTADVMCMQAFPSWGVAAKASSLGYPVSVVKSLLNGQAGQSEDCLVLDVYVPADIFNKGSEASAPVLFYIHGGGFTYGHKTSDGEPVGLVARSKLHGQSGAIVVSINYRLGLFGWLAGGEGIIPNLGLYDQKVAMEWVQQYISRFGGNPNKVTVMGESAGAASILHHITAYGGAAAPFQAAIPQSPAFELTIDYGSMYDQTLTAATSQLKAEVSDLATLIANLNESDASAALQTINQNVVYPQTQGHFGFGPVVDGTYVPKLPQVLLHEGNFDKSIKIMPSHTSNESVAFTTQTIATAADLRAYITENLRRSSNETINTLLNDVYPDVLDGTYPWYSEFGRLAQIQTDLMFACSTRYMANALGNDTYNYLFAVPPGYHGADRSYTFFNGDTTAVDGVAFNATVAYAMQDRILAFSMSEDWGASVFTPYGSEGIVTRYGDDGIYETVDDMMNDRCAWLQNALVEGLI